MTLRPRPRPLRRGRVLAAGVGLLTTVVLLAGPGLVTGSVASTGGGGSGSSAPGTYTPRPGVLFNKPLTAGKRRIINDHILNTINSTPGGAKIRIMSWNVKSFPYRRALIAAHNRGVSVRVIMSNGLAKKQSKTSGDYWILRRALGAHQSKRPADMTSWIRACVASCRGIRGIAHAKYYTFSNAGKASDIVMAGSANMTEVAASNQWNDMFTVVGKQGLYDWFQKIFTEASKDKRANPPYQTYTVSPTMSAWTLPYLGSKATGDPVTKILKRVQCTGATGGTGINGKTSIRIGQTAILDARGVQIAKLLKSLYNQGCNIRLAYTVLGPDVTKIIKSGSGRGPVPAHQIAQDFDGDGKFDRYLHMKDMVISGHYGSRTDASFVYNGTQNWTEVSSLSDEVGFAFYSRPIAQKYSDWIDRLYLNPPPNPHPVTGDGGVDRLANGKLGGAYEKVQLN